MSTASVNDFNGSGQGRSQSDGRQHAAPVRFGADDKRRLTGTASIRAVTDRQPPITPHSGLLSTDWLAGPHHGTKSSVVVSFTDFRADSDEDFQRIFHTGMKLRESWPIMRGAVGLWLWGKPAEFCGGALSVWESRDDLRRFVRWPVHTAIIKEWRGRIEVFSDSWDDERFDPRQAWSRAEIHMRKTRDLPSAPKHPQPDARQC
jgi:hypothetical protein